MSMEEPREFEKYKKRKPLAVGIILLVKRKPKTLLLIIYSVANEQYYCNLVYSTGF